MSRMEPLDQLACFYQSLDAIPTPQLAMNRPNRLGLWSLVLAPLSASLIAYAFISFCANAPAQPGPAFPLSLSLDRFALEEIKAAAPSERALSHVSNGHHPRSIA
jgi:hypothetical protein